MIKKCDEACKLFTFGMRDENSRLIQVEMPAKDYDEAVNKLKQFINLDFVADNGLFWLNDEEDY